MQGVDMPKVSFQQVVKAPATYLLIVMVGILWFFVGKYAGASDRISENCETEKKQLRADIVVIQVEYNKEKAKNEALTTALLVKNGIIDNIKQTTDSVYSDRVGDAAKKVLK